MPEVTCGSLSQEPVVILVEILGKEEMTVGIVVVGLDVEFRALHTSPGWKQSSIPSSAATPDQ